MLEAASSWLAPAVAATRARLRGVHARLVLLLQKGNGLLVLLRGTSADHHWVRRVLEHIQVSRVVLVNDVALRLLLLDVLGRSGALLLVVRGLGRLASRLACVRGRLPTRLRALGHSRPLLLALRLRLRLELLEGSRCGLESAKHLVGLRLEQVRNRVDQHANSRLGNAGGPEGVQHKALGKLVNVVSLVEDHAPTGVSKVDHAFENHSDVRRSFQVQNESWKLALVLLIVAVARRVVLVELLLSVLLVRKVLFLVVIVVGRLCEVSRGGLHLLVGRPLLVRLAALLIKVLVVILLVEASLVVLVVHVVASLVRVGLLVGVLVLLRALFREVPMLVGCEVRF